MCPVNSTFRTQINSPPGPRDAGIKSFFAGVPHPPHVTRSTLDRTRLARSGGHTPEPRVGGLEKPNHRNICDLMDGHVADPSRAQDRYPTVQSDASGFPTPLGHAWRRSGGHPGAARRVESLETPNHRNICDLIGGHVADPSRASFATQRCRQAPKVSLRRWGTPGAAQVATPEPRGASKASKTPITDISVI